MAAKAQQAQQVYVTHCLQSDSVRNEPGFSIRATSTDDAELLKFAADYHAYQLPLDMWSKEPRPAQAPRRLALVGGPGGTKALVHSAYVGEDTVGRQGNFFSHIVFFPELTATAALQTWGADAWQTSYPRGATQKLSPLDAKPFKGTIVNDDSLTRFLSGKPVDRTSDLATLVYPARLHGDARRSQALLAKTLDACLDAWGDAGNGRNRVYLLAEPGLMALLLYGVVRLLPEWADRDLTFSTYENAHHSLRQFKHALACGSYTSEPAKGLEPDYFRKRGFGLDTFVPERGSPELAGDPSEPAQFLVQLAALGRWEEIGKFGQDFHGSGTVATDSLNDARVLYGLFIRAQPNQPNPLTPEELLQMQRLPQGPALLRKHHVDLWPTIYRCSRANAAVSRAFASAIRQHTSEMAQQAGRLLAARNGQWQEVWRLIKTAEEAQDKLTERFLSLLQTAAQEGPEQPYLPAERVTLLQQWQEIAAGSATMPTAIRALLVVGNQQEFEELWSANLLTEWKWLTVTVQAAFRSPRPEPWAIEVLNNKRNDALTRAVAATLKENHAARDLLGVLRQLVPDRKSFPVFSHLIEHGLKVPPETLDGLLESCGGLKAVSSQHWLKGDHLRRLLLMTAQYGNGADAICLRFCRVLTQPRLPSDQQLPLWQLLDQVRKQWPGTFPADCALELDDWARLHTLLTDPAQVAGRRQAIEQACERRGYKYTVQLLHEHYYAVIHGKDKTDPAVSTFLETFDAIAPPGEYIEDQRHRFRLWLKIISSRKEPRRADLELFYLERKVTRNLQKDIIDDEEVRGKLAPSTIEAINSMVNVADGTEAEAVPIEPKVKSEASRAGRAALDSFWTAPLVVWHHSSWSQLGCLVAAMFFALIATAVVSLAFGRHTAPPDHAAEKIITEAKKQDRERPSKSPEHDDSVRIKKEDLAAHAAVLRRLVDANPNAKHLKNRLERAASGNGMRFDILKDVAAKLADLEHPTAQRPLIDTSAVAVTSLRQNLKLVELIVESEYLREYVEPNGPVLRKYLTTTDSELSEGKLNAETIAQLTEHMRSVAARIGKAEKPKSPKDIRKEVVRDFLKHAYSDELLKAKAHGITHGKPPNPKNVDLVVDIYTTIRDAQRAREKAAHANATANAVALRPLGFALPDLGLTADMVRIEIRLTRDKKRLGDAWDK